MLIRITKNIIFLTSGKPVHAEYSPAGPSVVPLEYLLHQHEISPPPEDVWQVRFHDLPEGITAYNASSVFIVDQVPHILARTELEGGDGEFTSKVSIFQCSPDGRDCWPAGISNLPELTEGKITQDPSISRVNGNRVITWVEVTPVDINDPTKGSDFKSVTYTGKTLDTLQLLAESSNGIKGVRYVELLNNKVGVTTRPFINGVGATCFTVVNSLEDITTEILDSAEVIDGLATDVGWGGPNELILLANGDVAVLGHTARFVSEEGKPTTRVYDVEFYVIAPEPDGKQSTPAKAKYLEIIATEADFEISEETIPPKKDDLIHVAYPSCILLGNAKDSLAILLVALRDSGEVGALIQDPLKKWRQDYPDYANSALRNKTLALALAA